MKTFNIFIFCIVVSNCGVLTLPYNTGNHQLFRTSIRSQSGAPISQRPCCNGAIVLTPWALAHIEHVKIVANGMRQQYYIFSQNGQSSYHAHSGISSYIYPLYGDKTQEEMRLLVSNHARKIYEDLKAGRLIYERIIQPNFFEQESATLLEQLDESDGNNQQQYQNVFEHGYGGSGSGSDIVTFEKQTHHSSSSSSSSQTSPGLIPSNFHEFNTTHIAHPTETVIIGGKTYIIKKNCTTTTYTGHPTTLPSAAAYGNGLTSHSLYQHNRTENQQNAVNPIYIGPGHTTYEKQTTNINRHHTNKPTYANIYSSGHSIYNQNSKEAQVRAYSPTVTIDEQLMAKINREGFATPQVVIPIGNREEFELTENNERHQFGGSGSVISPQYTSTINEVEDLTKTGIRNQIHYQPSGGHETVTIRKFNKTIITRPDGTPIVGGSESQTVIDDGKIVYDVYRPFGTWSQTQNTIIQEEEWKKQERERLYWLFQQNSVNREMLSKWQREQEDRLHSLAYRYNTTVEDIEEWQRHELNRFNTLNNQQIEMTDNLKEWQQKERGRINWLLKQNSLTREELDKWQLENQGRLNNLARQYRVSIEELEEWQKKELDRLYTTFTENNSELNTLREWQVQERNRLNNIIIQHNVTVEQLQEQIRRDQEKLGTLSQQYHINVSEMEKWLKNELGRLTGIITKQQEEINRITEWQRSERDRLEMISRQHNFTVEELEQRLQHDRNYLNSLARKYHVTIEELEEWQQKEVTRLKETGTLNIERELKEWQKNERDRLMLIAQQNDITIEEFERKIKDDRHRLNMLAQQYQIQVEEIEDWVRNETTRLQAQGLLKKVEEELNEWQTKERNRLLLIVQKNELTIEELESRLRNDQDRLNMLALQYKVQVEEIEDWMKKEFTRLQGQGLVKIEELKDWQKIERDRLLMIVQQNELTIEEFQKQIQEDQHRLQQMAHQYHISVEEVEDFIRKEVLRLKGEGLIKVTEEETITEWQKKERDNLMSMAYNNYLTIEEFEERLKKDRFRLEEVAWKYQVSIDEIEEWIRNEANRLVAMNLIHLKEKEEIIEWHQRAREYMEQLMQQHTWSIEEFERKLTDDRHRLQAMALEYQTTVEELETWYKKEVQRLLQQGKLYSEHLEEWQRQEKDRLYRIIKQQEYTIQELEKQLWKDRQDLYALAEQYRITIEELESWQRNELDRLYNLGLVRDLTRGELSDWQMEERRRLNYIAQEVQISHEEFEEFLKYDINFQASLAANYRVSNEQLEQWQHLELQRLLNEGRLDERQLIRLENWQKRERDRLYILIHGKRFTQNDLAKWQNEHELINEIAAQYRISVDVLKLWQREELIRLLKIARHYRMTIAELENFRRMELERLKTVAHMSSYERNNDAIWRAQENARFDELSKRYGQSLHALTEWRRYLFLLSQGRLHMDFGGDEKGGMEIDTNTGASGRRNITISKDRGDQPPSTYGDYDEHEPGIGNYSIEASIGSTTSRPYVYSTRPHTVIPAAPIRAAPSIPGSHTEYTRTQRKKVVTYTVPVPVVVGSNTHIENNLNTINTHQSTAPNRFNYESGSDLQHADKYQTGSGQISASGYGMGGQQIPNTGGQYSSGSSATSYSSTDGSFSHSHAFSNPANNQHGFNLDGMPMNDQQHTEHSDADIGQTAIDQQYQSSYTENRKTEKITDTTNYHNRGSGQIEQTAATIENVAPENYRDYGQQVQKENLEDFSIGQENYRHDSGQHIQKENFNEFNQQIQHEDLTMYQQNQKENLEDFGQQVEDKQTSFNTYNNDWNQNTNTRRGESSASTNIQSPEVKAEPVEEKKTGFFGRIFG